MLFKQIEIVRGFNLVELMIFYKHSRSICNFASNYFTYFCVFRYILLQWFAHRQFFCLFREHICTKIHHNTFTLTLSVKLIKKFNYRLIKEHVNLNIAIENYIVKFVCRVITLQTTIPYQNLTKRKTILLTKQKQKKQPHTHFPSYNIEWRKTQIFLWNIPLYLVL